MSIIKVNFSKKSAFWTEKRKYITLEKILADSFVLLPAQKALPEQAIKCKAFKMGPESDKKKVYKYVSYLIECMDYTKVWF